MVKKLLLVFSFLAMLAGLVLAADVTGKWIAQMQGRNGQTREVTFTFKVDGDTLTGSTSGRQGQETPIADGKISGDTISFTVTREFGGNTMKQTYTGKVSGDEIQFKVESGQGPARDMVAKRAK
jgi:hypothetical protein